MHKANYHEKIIIECIMSFEFTFYNIHNTLGILIKLFDQAYYYTSLNIEVPIYSIISKGIYTFIFNLG